MGANQSNEEAQRRDREFQRHIDARLREHEQRMQNKIQESRVTITTSMQPSEFTRDVASKRDLEKALEKQREIYEKKMKDILKNTNQEDSSTQRIGPSKSDLEKALEEQRQLYEMKIKNILDNQLRQTNNPGFPPHPTMQHAGMQQAAVMQPNFSQQPFGYQAAAQQAAAQQAAAQQAAAQQAAAQQAAAQQAAAQQAAAQKAAAQQAAKKAAAQQAAAQQAAAQQAAAQQAAAQQAAKKAAAQQAAAQQAAAKQAEKEAAQKKAVAAQAQREAAQMQAAAAQAQRQAAEKQAAAQQAEREAKQKKAAAKQQTVPPQTTAQQKQAIQAIATESVKRMHENGLTLRQTLNYSIDQLKAMKVESAPPNIEASGGKSGGKKTKGEEFVIVDVPFKDSFQNVQKSRLKGEEDDITCPTCGSRYTGNIYKCKKGHSACHLCRMRQVNCFTCRQPITDVRNCTLEQYVAERRIKCPNADDGCRLFIKTSLIDTHIKDCPFNPMGCPCLGPCDWIGKLPQLSAHFDDKHPAHCQGDVNKELFLPNISTDNRTMHLIKIGNFHFLFHVNVSSLKQRVGMVAQLIGQIGTARAWTYEVHVYNKKEPHRKFFFQDKCSSNRESLEDIFGTGKCAVLPLSYAKTFFNEGALIYKVSIKKLDADKDNYKMEEKAEIKKRYKRRYGKTMRDN